MKRINWLIATFFGVGKIPGAPGTWGSLAAVPCFYYLARFPLAHIGLLPLLFFLGVYASTQTEKAYGETDPSWVVIDEVLGIGIAMVGIPMDWPFVIMAFILFRLFDIWKPYPIRKLEALPGGWGIMADDLLAGVYANIWIRIGVFLVNMLA
ncbi:MAG TPA: phosphatidylglycerophosphatase A [bacterium]|nr:phosphatidylglycerophosphatase A [bacterium]